MRAIFISYRRGDSEGQAGRLFTDLVRHFGAQAVFMDVDSIEPGRDFRKVIDEHVSSCGVLLALIGKEWLDAKDDNGARRIDAPGDFVRLETASALKRDIPVVPVLVQGAHMPRAEQLPADLADLAYRNGIELTHARWDSDLTVLVKALSRYVPTKSAAADSETSMSSAQATRASRRTPLAAASIAGIAALLVGAWYIAKDDGSAPAAAGSQMSAASTTASIDDSTNETAAAPATEAKPKASKRTLNAAHPTFSANMTPFGVADWDRDGRADVIVRDAIGGLWLYPGAGKRDFGRAARVQIGSGWKEYTPFGIADWDRDGHQDIVAREDSTGLLWLYPGESKRGVANVPRVEIGNGWNGYTPFGIADWDGDRHQDIVTRDKDGFLWLYPGESQRGMSNTQRTPIGNGWNGYTPFGLADWDGDGHQDILTRDKDNDMWLYPGESKRTMSDTQRVEIGNAWDGYVAFGLADWDRDGHEDIVAQDGSSGEVWLYPGQSKRGTADAQQVRIGAGR